MRDDRRMDAAGGLLDAIAGSIGGLVARSVSIVESIVGGLMASLQSILPGPWLPIAAVIVLVVLFRLVKR